MTDRVTSPVPETARQAAELEAMLQMLHLSSGCFSLSIAVCNSPALRDYLIEKLQQSRPDVHVIRIPPGITDVLEYVRRHMDVSKCSAVFIVGLEELLSSSEARHPVLRSLNASRELWERDLHCPVVIWLPEYAAGMLSLEAPDLWRYRSHRFEFVSELAGAASGARDSTSGDIGLASNLSADEKRFRIAELEQRIEEAGPTPSKPLVQYVAVWLNELAFLRKSLGEIDLAEETLRKALALHEELGRKEGMAIQYGNLGILYRIRGDLEAAEQMYRKALALHEELGRKEGMATVYGNLGNLYETRGDLEAAEQMYRKALALHEELGSKAGIATQYGNLGIVYETRGDLEAAEQMYRKALALHEELGRKEGMAMEYGNLGLVYRTRGDLEAAEQMHRKALALHEELGSKDGMAADYGNLGIVCGIRGDLETAEQMLTRALELFRDVGAERNVKKTERSLRELRRSQ